MLLVRACYCSYPVDVPCIDFVKLRWRIAQIDTMSTSPVLELRVAITAKTSTAWRASTARA